MFFFKEGYYKNISTDKKNKNIEKTKLQIKAPKKKSKKRKKNRHGTSLNSEASMSVNESCK